MLFSCFRGTRGCAVTHTRKVAAGEFDHGGESDDIQEPQLVLYAELARVPGF